ncbi:MAG: peptidylprolyl isomerase [Clostridia bacterium]|nr:peptidylprolyl isomerase [Clostridia bacterium]
MIRIEMEDGGTIDLVLDPAHAPVTCSNFEELVRSGFYDGLIFHRVIPGFMIQGGDPTGTGTGGSGKRIRGEFDANGIRNPLRHTRGVISMARSSDPDSASSQFFICQESAPHLDGQYAAFGKVIRGMEVVDRIAQTETDRSNRPVREIRIRKISLIQSETKPTPYPRYSEEKPRRLYPAKRYASVRAKIGYLFRSGPQIFHRAWPLSDPDCREGELLLAPPVSFSEVYDSEIQPRLRNDSNVEAAAVYFNPYDAQFLIIGSRSLYEDCLPVIGTAGTPVFLEKESPRYFNPLNYGAFRLPNLNEMSFEDCFREDAVHRSPAEYMVRRVWDGETVPHSFAVEFFDRFSSRLSEEKAEGGPDLQTELAVAILREKNAPLLSRLFTLHPQILALFRITEKQETKFVGGDGSPRIVLPDTGTPADSDKPPLFNLFQYCILSGDPDCIQTLFTAYERPMELRQFLSHPMFYHAGYYLIRSGNIAALSLLLENGYPADCADLSRGRLTVLSQSCLCDSPSAAALLLRYGADSLRKDNTGKNPFDYAMETRSPACLSVLLDHLIQGRDREKAATQMASLASRLELTENTDALAAVLSRYLRKIREQG